MEGFRNSAANTDTELKDLLERHRANLEEMSRFNEERRKAADRHERLHEMLRKTENELKATIAEEMRIKGSIDSLEDRYPQIQRVFGVSEG